MVDGGGEGGRMGEKGEGWGGKLNKVRGRERERERERERKNVMRGK